MKKLISILAVFSIVAVIVFAQVTNTPPPTGQIFVPANPATNILAAPVVRIVGGQLVVDPDQTKWIFWWTVETWSSSTNGSILGRTNIPMTLAQMKTLVNSANPFQALQNSAMAAAGMTAKP